MKKIFLMMFALATFILSGCNTQAATLTGAQNIKGDLEISMFNIGRGDAILIRTKEQTILIDSASTTERDRFVSELEKFSVTKIDKMILTHPHADHIGGADLIIRPNKKQLEKYPYLKKVSVNEVYDTGVIYTSGTYRNYVKLANSTGVVRQSLKDGDTLDFGGGVKFKVFFPTEDFVAEINKRQEAKLNKDDEEDKEDKEVKKDRTYAMNNSSLVGKLTYKNFSMMFTGDSEKESEKTILAANDAKDLKCDVLKSGHHGLQTSSAKAFVAAINPSVILISAGNKVNEGNFKGAPHAKPLLTYMEQGVKSRNIFCTQWNGSITIISDGKNFSVKPEVNVDWVEDWIAKKRKANVR